MTDRYVDGLQGSDTFCASEFIVELCAMDNRYQPTKTEIYEQNPPPNLAVKGLMIGLLVDFGAGLALNIAVPLVYLLLNLRDGMTAQEVTQTMLRVHQVPYIFVWLKLMACGFSVLGGYVCAHTARRKDLRLGVVQGVLTVVLGLCFARIDEHFTFPIVATVALLMFASVLLGAWLSLQRKPT